MSRALMDVHADMPHFGGEIQVNSTRTAASQHVTVVHNNNTTLPLGETLAMEFEWLCVCLYWVNPFVYKRW